MADLDQIAGRPAQYLSETGTPQLMSGLALLILGSSALIQTSLLTARGATPWSLVVQYVGLCCVGIVWWRLSALKQRMVFPRGGYVKARGPSRPYLSAFLVASAGLAYLVATLPRFRAGLESPLVWPVFMIVFALIFLDTGRRQKQPLFLWFGVYIACLAPLLWLLPVKNNYARSGALMVAIGAPLAVLGTLRLRRFVRSNPMPPEPRDE